MGVLGCGYASITLRRRFLWLDALIPRSFISVLVISRTETEMTDTEMKDLGPAPGDDA